MSAKIDQKEYLKKYLSNDVGGTHSKKKKKRDKPSKHVKAATIKIIDDDIDLSQLKGTNEDDIERFNMGEDAPQIVGVIDDRPPELIAKEDYGKSIRWKTIGKHDSEVEKTSTQSREKRRDSDASPPRRRPDRSDASQQVVRRSSKTPDESPPRRRRSADLSPPRQRKRKESPDQSPPRRRQRQDSDASPPRRRMDSSPPRHRKQSPRSDASPSREKNASPHRRLNRSRSRERTSPRQRDRRSEKPQRRPNRKRSGSKDISPPRRRQRSAERSPRQPFKRSSPPPKRQHDSRDRPKPGTSDSPPPAHKKMVKTLEGKIAGLQDATALREENERFQRREEELYKKMTKDQPRDVEVNVRKTGRRRNLEQDSAAEMEKMRKEAERKAVYDRWGKGLKQIEDYKERVAEETHEQSKPLARYSNDKDLDDYLKQQHRDGDPKAKYFQKKSIEGRTGPTKPVYQGPFPDNRFNIRPGYRWDGVDRSNGYEVKWFQAQSKKVAVEEEAYKYSVEDM